MTYKLNPELQKILSPVLLIFPNDATARYSSGQELVDAVFDHPYQVKSLRAKEATVVIELVERVGAVVNPIGEETFF